MTDERSSFASRIFAGVVPYRLDILHSVSRRRTVWRGVDVAATTPDDRLVMLDTYVA